MEYRRSIFRRYFHIRAGWYDFSGGFRLQEPGGGAAEQAGHCICDSVGDKAVYSPVRMQAGGQRAVVIGTPGMRLDPT